MSANRLRSSISSSIRDRHFRLRLPVPPSPIPDAKEDDGAAMEVRLPPKGRPRCARPRRLRNTTSPRNALPSAETIERLIDENIFTIDEMDLLTLTVKRFFFYGAVFTLINILLQNIYRFTYMYMYRVYQLSCNIKNRLISASKKDIIILKKGLKSF